MFELTKLELIKLCRKKVTVITTLVCFIGTVIFFLLPYLQFLAWDANGTMLSRGEAISYRKNVYASLSGELTEERVLHDIKEYQNMHSNPENVVVGRGGESSFKDEIFYQYFEPRHSYLDLLGNTYSSNELGAENLLNVNLEDGAKFYQARENTIIDRINNNEDLNSVEKDYWKNKALSVKTPFRYGYVLGWANFGQTSELLIICILGICIAVSSVFAGEYQTGADAVILSTRYGKTKIIGAKLISTFLFATVVFIFNAFIALGLCLKTFGAEGGNLPLQMASTICPYNLTFKQAAYISIGIAYIVMLGMVSFTLLLSSKMKSAFSVLSIDILAVIVPMFFSLCKETALLPSMATLGGSLFNYYISYNVGNIVINQFIMIIIAYALVITISLFLSSRFFQKHQV